MAETRSRKGGGKAAQVVAKGAEAGLTFKARPSSNLIRARPEMKASEAVAEAKVAA